MTTLQVVQEKRKFILNIANSRLNFLGSSISINICQTRPENSFLIKQSSEIYEKVHVYIDIRL